MTFTDVFGMVVFVTVMIMGFVCVIFPLFEKYLQRKGV